MDETQRWLRAGIYGELAQYATPKRKALEHKGETAANFYASEVQSYTPASCVNDVCLHGGPAGLTADETTPATVTGTVPDST